MSSSSKLFALLSDLLQFPPNVKVGEMPGHVLHSDPESSGERQRPSANILWNEQLQAGLPQGDQDHEHESFYMTAALIKIQIWRAPLQLTEIMLTSNYMGLTVTYESMTCGQIAGIVGTDKHCKVENVLGQINPIT